jgi:hypothetical protein
VGLLLLHRRNRGVRVEVRVSARGVRMRVGQRWFRPRDDGLIRFQAPYLGRGGGGDAAATTPISLFVWIDSGLNLPGDARYER